MAEETKNQKDTEAKAAEKPNEEASKGAESQAADKPAEGQNPEPAEEKAEVAASEGQAQTAVAEEKGDAAKDEEKPKVQLSEKMENLIKTVEEMTVLELSELVKAIEDRFGVSAAAPVMTVAAMPGAAGAAGGAEVEEKSLFSVVLSEIGSNKIQVIKEIRALTSLGLKEAKDLVEAAPKEVKGDVLKEDADKMKKQLEAVGAKVELK